MFRSRAASDGVVVIALAAVLGTVRYGPAAGPALADIAQQSAAAVRETVAEWSAAALQQSSAEYSAGPWGDLELYPAYEAPCWEGWATTSRECWNGRAACR